MGSILETGFARLSGLDTVFSSRFSLLADWPVDDRLIGKGLFVAVFALLIVWLVLIPRHRLGHAEQVPPWWRNVRIWGIVVATTQMLVYLFWE